MRRLLAGNTPGRSKGFLAAWRGNVGRHFRGGLMAAAALLLGACGFQLRGAYALPFETMQIGLPPSTELYAALKRNIEAATQTRVVDDAAKAQAILTVTSDTPSKTVLSLSSTGRVTEFQLMRTVAFRVHDAAGRDLMPPGQIVIRREISFSDVQVLAKESEEALLWRDIQNDLVQQLLRRLATAKLAKAG